MWGHLIIQVGFYGCLQRASHVAKDKRKGVKFSPRFGFLHDKKELLQNCV